MIKAMPVARNNQWLEDVVSNLAVYHDKLPLRKLLENSLYYPACGLNGTPVKYLGGNILSFVYADYSLTSERYTRNLLGSGPGDGFKGFRCIFEREVALSEVVPAGWHPPLTPASPEDISRIHARERSARPFGHWSIWEKADPAAEGGDCFSFFYLGGEMNAVYQGLYNRLAIRPKVLAIISPGLFGGEWEGVESDNSFFKKVVSANPAGLPDYLLHGHGGCRFDSRRYFLPCWKEYAGQQPLAQLDERFARLWRLCQGMCQAA